ncbi:MAG: hypothetical protein NZ914_14810, partial [Gemmatales bacterium]|nr:hypothetical protein [Gemmatales bacterium]
RLGADTSRGHFEGLLALRTERATRLGADTSRPTSRGHFSAGLDTLRGAYGTRKSRSLISRLCTGQARVWYTRVCG